MYILQLNKLFVLGELKVYERFYPFVLSRLVWKKKDPANLNIYVSQKKTKYTHVGSRCTIAYHTTKRMYLRTYIHVIFGGEEVNFVIFT